MKEQLGPQDPTPVSIQYEDKKRKFWNIARFLLVNLDV